MSDTTDPSPAPQQPASVPPAQDSPTTPPAPAPSPTAQGEGASAPYPAPAQEQASGAQQQPAAQPQPGYPAAGQPYAPQQPQHPVFAPYGAQSHLQPQPHTQPTQPLPQGGPFQPQPHQPQQHQSHHAPQGSAFGPGAQQGMPPVPPAQGYGEARPQEPKRRKGGGVGVGIAAGIIAGVVFGGAAGAGAAYVVGSNQPAQSSTSAGRETITVNNPQDASLITSVAAVAAPSVVTISAFASDGTGATGSGVVVDDQGHIVTNNHVATIDGATNNAELTIQTYDGRLLPAKIVATDPIVDLAVLQVDGLNLPAIQFADSSKLNVGDVTVAIGAPLDLPGTVTSGVVSALDRGIQVQSSAVPDQSQQDQNQQQSPFDFWNQIPGTPGQQTQPQQSSGGSSISLPVIQTDAAINPGNSGGALLDKDGKLIGINVAIAGSGSSDGSQSGSIGLGFAIPSNLVKRAVDELISHGSVSHGLFGATVTDPTASDSSVAGALIKDVTPGGPAAAAGVQSGDVVTVFDGHPITNSTDLTAEVRALPAGSKVQFTYVRGGKSQTATVTLGSLSS